MGITGMHKGLGDDGCGWGKRDDLVDGLELLPIYTCDGDRKMSHIIARESDRVGACERKRNSNKRPTRGAVQIQGYGRNRKESESDESGPSVMTPSKTSGALDHLARKKLYNGEDHALRRSKRITSIDVAFKER